MGQIQPFYAVTKQYVITDAEASQVRNRLGIVRRQLIIEQRAPLRDSRMISVLRKEIDALEHKLAHSEIIDTEDASVREEGDQALFVKNILGRARKKLSDEIQILRHAL